MQILEDMDTLSSAQSVRIAPRLDKAVVALGDLAGRWSKFRSLESGCVDISRQTQDMRIGPSP